MLLCAKEALFSFEDVPSSLPPAVTNILQEFADVFPQDVPLGLPPIRGIEHQIYLIPGASLPNRASYRTNSEDTKEIMRQVQELLDKGYIHESLSPCVVPIILVPKRMLRHVCALIVEALIILLFVIIILFLG